MFIIIFLYLLYASIFVIGKYAIMTSQPVFLTGVRMACAGVISYALHCFWYKTPQFSLLKKMDWFIIVLIAFFNVYMTNAGEFWSLQYMSAGKTSFIYNFSPFLVLIFSAILFSEKVTWRKLLGMLIGFLSVMPMLIGDTSVIDTTRHFGPLSVAEFVMLGAATATSLGWVLMRYFVHRHVLTPYFLNSVSLLLGGMMCLVHSFLFENRPFIITDSMSEFIFYMSAMMLIQNVGAYNLHAHLLKHCSATLVALFLFVMPLQTVILGKIFLGEPITYMFFLCSAGVALGLFVFYLDEIVALPDKK